MNFIGTTEGQEIQVELKYCERCGGLWLRAQGAAGVDCASCRVRLASMPNRGDAPPRKRRKRRNRAVDAQRVDIQSQARVEYLHGVAATEVWA